MPVEDTPVHPHGIRTVDHRATCYNKPRERGGYWAKDGLRLDHSAGTIGVYNVVWVVDTSSVNCRQMLDLPECVGCTVEKDHDYINKMKELSK